VRAPKGYRIYTISIAGKSLHLSPTGRTSAEVAVNLPAGKTAAVRFIQDRAPQTPPKKYTSYRARHPLKIDGKLADSAWSKAPWTDYFVDIEGDLKPAPRFRTRAKMLWDDRYLYIGAQLQEPHVWATLTKRDSVIFRDNDFEFFIDPDGDTLNYYEGEINALNTFWDLRLVKPYRDGGPALNSWDIKGLKKAIHVQGTLNNPQDTDSGWSVEIAIPWKALGEFTQVRSPPHHGDQWRVNFSRVEWRHEIDDKNRKSNPYRKIPGLAENNWVWTPQGIIDMHQPEMWGYVRFSTRTP
jgi:hypothetical protein